MADKFSLDDIVAEYSGKSAAGGNDNEEFSVDEIVEETNEDILHTSEIPAVNGTRKRESIFTAKESDATGENKAAAVNAVIRDGNADSSEHRSEKLFARRSDREPIDVKDLEKSIKAEKERDKKRSEENAQVIENLMKLKRQRGTVKKNEDVSPVNRPNVKDIDMGLTGKIIPKTEELDKAVDIPDNATYEEKAAILSQRRKKKIDNFKLKTDESEAL